MSAETPYDLVAKFIANRLGIAVDTIKPNMALIDIGGDSLDIVEMVLDVEDILEIRLDENKIIGLPTVGAIIEFVVNSISTQTTSEDISVVLTRLNKEAINYP